jgi:hypothetical protein
MARIGIEIRDFMAFSSRLDARHTGTGRGAIERL